MTRLGTPALVAAALMLALLAPSPALAGTASLGTDPSEVQYVAAAGEDITLLIGYDD